METASVCLEYSFLMASDSMCKAVTARHSDRDAAAQWGPGWCLTAGNQPEHQEPGQRGLPAAT